MRTDDGSIFKQEQLASKPGIWISLSVVFRMGSFQTNSGSSHTSPNHRYPSSTTNDGGSDASNCRDFIASQNTSTNSPIRAARTAIRPFRVSDHALLGLRVAISSLLFYGVLAIA